MTFALGWEPKNSNGSMERGGMGCVIAAQRLACRGLWISACQVQGHEGVMRKVVCASFMAEKAKNRRPVRIK